MVWAGPDSLRRHRRPTLRAWVSCPCLEPDGVEMFGRGCALFTVRVMRSKPAAPANRWISLRVAAGDLFPGIRLTVDAQICLCVLLQLGSASRLCRSALPFEMRRTSWFSGVGMKRAAILRIVSDWCSSADWPNARFLLQRFPAECAEAWRRFL